MPLTPTFGANEIHRILEELAVCGWSGLERVLKKADIRQLPKLPPPYALISVICSQD
jgi:hypothetical protein